MRLKKEKRIVTQLIALSKKIEKLINRKMEEKVRVHILNEPNCVAFESVRKKDRKIIREREIKIYVIENTWALN